MRDIVVISLESWNQVWRRNQHLVAGLLAADPGLRVLFVEPPADPAHDLATRRRPTWGHRPRRVEGQPRLVTYRPVKWLPRRLDPQADRRLARFVMRTSRRVGFTRPVLWINDPGAGELSRLSGWPTLYDMTDDWLAADRPPTELGRLTASETMLLGSAAEVVACSPELVRRKSVMRVGGPITLIQNAVDVRAYQRPTSRPADMPPGRVALYLGTLHADRLDVALTADTATALRGSGTLVLVGPDLLEPADSRRLRVAGAVVLGARSKEEVIAYLQHADLLVVPHLVNAFTDSLDPIKLYEYQAVAKPVVSTAVAGFREAEGDMITIADEQDFPSAARALLDRRSPVSNPRTPAPDWTDRVADVIPILHRLAGPKWS